MAFDRTRKHLQSFAVMNQTAIVAPATKYDSIGIGYAPMRRPDPRIAAQIHAALGDAASIINVGAGAGSYEPTDRRVVAANRRRS